MQTVIKYVRAYIKDVEIQDDPTCGKIAIRPNQTRSEGDDIGDIEDQVPTGKPDKYWKPQHGRQLENSRRKHVGNQTQLDQHKAWCDYWEELLEVYKHMTKAGFDADAPLPFTLGEVGCA